MSIRTITRVRPSPIPCALYRPTRSPKRPRALSRRRLVRARKNVMKVVNQTEAHCLAQFANLPSDEGEDHGRTYRAGFTANRPLSAGLYQVATWFFGREHAGRCLG